MRRVSVHHFVVTEITKPQSVAWRRSDLLGVAYWVDVPADTEFPKTLPRLQLFTRFYLNRAKPIDFRVRVVWLDRADNLEVEIGNFGPFPVPFARNLTVRDCSFNLHNIRLEGVGRYRVELLRLRSTAFWEEAEWVVIAQTHFYVER